MSKLSVVIQAGGKSSRMGQDKALMPFMGTTMLGYIIQQVKGLGDEIIIISNAPKSYQQFGYPVFTDVIPDWGALGGLYSAIYYASHETCLVLACDMPLINRALLTHLIDLIENHDAVMPRLSAKFAEPFRAVYRKTCLGPIKNAIDGNQRRVISFFDEVDIRFVRRDELMRFDPDLLSFQNANTPDELAAIEKIASDL